MNDDALARIQSFLRAAASKGRETARFGPFLATLTPTSDNPFLNYAIPDADAEPAAEDVAALAAFYESRGRKPRLEYVPELAPRALAALLAGGFAVEARAPLMVLDALRPMPVPEGAELIEAEDEATVRALVAVLNEAYGGKPPTDEEVRRQWRRVQDGTIALLARVGGEPAGGGLVLPPEDGLTEVTSIGVRAPFRRRGLAAALVARLTELARAGGAELPFLMAAAEAEARIYARVGYRTLGEMLFVSR